MILIEAFPKWKENKGIFEYFPDPPWKDVISSVELNLEYFGNISGSKGISPLVSKMLTDGILEDSSRQSLALLISSKFKVNWMRLWNAEVAVYDPVHNYDMHEEGTRTGNNRNESQSTDETHHGRSNTSRYSHYGFNSQSSNPSDEDVTTEGGTTNLNRNGSVDYTINEGTTLHRYGNIGVTTNQQMIEAERSIRMWNYFNSVYKDIDSVLAIRIYDPCSVKKITPSISNPNPSKPEYSLPIASAETLGGVKIGDGVDISEDGKISVPKSEYSLPIASAETLGGVKIGDGVNISEDGKISVPKPADLPFNFGIDENGNYGYIKVGADSVTPFSKVSLVPVYSTGIGNRYISGSESSPKIYIDTVANYCLSVYEITKGNKYVFFVVGTVGNRFRVAQSHKNPLSVANGYNLIAPAIKDLMNPRIEDCIAIFEASGNYLVAQLSGQSQQINSCLIDVTKIFEEEQ